MTRNGDQDVNLHALMTACPLVTKRQESAMNVYQDLDLMDSSATSAVQMDVSTNVIKRMEHACSVSQDYLGSIVMRPVLGAYLHVTSSLDSAIMAAMMKDVGDANQDIMENSVTSHVQKLVVMCVVVMLVAGRGLTAPC